MAPWVALWIDGSYFPDWKIDIVRLVSCNLANELNRPVGHVRWDIISRLYMAQRPCIWRDDALLVGGVCSRVIPFADEI